MGRIIWRSFRNALVVNVRIGSPAGGLDDTIELEAKIDTGMSLSKSPKYDVALLLPESLESNFRGAETPVMVPIRFRNKTGAWRQVYLVDVQLICNSGVSWPDSPLTIQTVFFGEVPTGLIGVALWRRWRTVIDGLRNRFEIWVP